jgi:hypothetical protein
VLAHTNSSARVDMSLQPVFVFTPKYCVVSREIASYHARLSVVDYVLVIMLV